MIVLNYSDLKNIESGQSLLRSGIDLDSVFGGIRLDTRHSGLDDWRKVSFLSDFIVFCGLK